MTYVATGIAEDLQPYSWYVNHVLIGANETPLPGSYIQNKILSVASVDDKNKARDAEQRAIYS